MIRVILTGIILLGCTKNTHKSNLSYVSGDFNRSNYKSKKIIILPLSKGFLSFENNSMAIKKNGDDSLISENAFLKYFNQKLISTFKKNYSSFKINIGDELYDEFINGISREGIHEIELPLGEFGVQYPFSIYDSNYLKKNGIENDIILMISKYDFLLYDEVNKIHYENNINEGLSCGSMFSYTYFEYLDDSYKQSGICWTAQISSTLRYIIWDYEGNVPLAYGQIKPITAGNWNDLNKLWNTSVTDALNKLKIKLPELGYFLK